MRGGVFDPFLRRQRKATGAVLQQPHMSNAWVDQTGS
jgi:hypothetical protein